MKINAMDPLRDLESKGHGQYTRSRSRSMTLSFKVT